MNNNCKNFAGFVRNILFILTWENKSQLWIFIYASFQCSIFWVSFWVWYITYSNIKWRAITVVLNNKLPHFLNIYYQATITHKVRSIFEKTKTGGKRSEGSFSNQKMLNSYKAILANRFTVYSPKPIFFFVVSRVTSRYLNAENMFLIVFGQPKIWQC